MPSIPHSGISDPRIATMAAAARMEPTERSMPPVRMTKVIPAASTVLMEACCATMERFWKLMNRPDMSSNTTPRMISTGSMPSACRVERQARRRCMLWDAASGPTAAGWTDALVSFGGVIRRLPLHLSQWR
jgi:hypothetical protein